MNILCPICKNKNKLKLATDEKSYICSKNHSFDISKSGYLNLLVSKTNSGDNKDMVNARSNFLNKGYYEPLAIKIKEVVNKYSPDYKNVVDAGCGTGYYSNYLKNSNSSIYGFDISKFAIDKAKKLQKENNYFVASTSFLPIEDDSVDVLLTVFAPTFPNEFFRVLKKDAIFVLVVPNHNHLYELKKALYDKPYLNEDKDYSILNSNFTLVEKLDLTYKTNINNDDLLQLVKMTPYFYKTNPTRIDKLDFNNDELTLDFSIFVYKK